MVDDKSKRGQPDRIRISPGEAYELRYWKQELGVSGQQVVGAVRAVGPMVADVKPYLSRKKDRDAKEAQPQQPILVCASGQSKIEGGVVYGARPRTSLRG